MGTTLTGTKPKDTYDSLIKVEDNGPISGTAKYLSDGLGNNLPIAVSTSNVGIGTAAPAFKLDVTGDVRTNVASGNGSLYINNSSLTSKFWTLIPETAAGETNLLFFYGGAGASTKMTMLAGGGLTFNGDTAAANALDDYEEGTWTMGVSFGGASVGVTYTSNTGTYTKIGRQVTVNGFVALSSKGSSTGAARITGLPYVIANTNSNYSAPSLNFSSITFANQLQGLGDINATTIALEEVSILGAVTGITDADFANGSYIVLSFTYFV